MICGSIMQETEHGLGWQAVALLSPEKKTLQVMSLVHDLVQLDGLIVMPKTCGCLVGRASLPVVRSRGTKKTLDYFTE